ncbi:hypothetical protein JYU34_003984 [Plutella xylostella]|uniref:Uncharacterized protein n=1 Tax=Plutella xylostella TaxID=51655 RepID=A0ABQ7QWW9_PLUXY|nr:hypothetical protein JYU34_003984 [Plutella xylostella]
MCLRGIAMCVPRVPPTLSVRWLQGVKRSVDSYKISPYTSAEIIAVKVPPPPPPPPAVDRFKRFCVVVFSCIYVLFCSILEYFIICAAASI